MLKIAILAFALVLTALSPTSNAQPGTNGEQASAELAAVGSAIEEIQVWLSDANEAASAEEIALKNASRELAAVATRLSEAQTDIAHQSEKIDALRTQATELAEQKAQQTEAVAQLLRTLYRRGTPTALETLLNQDELGSDGRMRYYARSLSEEQFTKIAELESTLELIAGNEAALTTGLVELTQQQQTLLLQQQALASAREAQSEALQQLRSKIKTRADELEQLEISQAELQQLIEEIRQAMEGIRSFDDVPPFAAARGSLPLPVPGTLSSAFGQQYGGGSLTRQGITLAVAPGTAVQAVHAGHVVFADWLRGSGLLVIIDHGNGFMSLYGGNESLATQSGEWVDSGDVIATSGNPSNSSSPGLYFEIRERGQAMNPEVWLRTN